MKKLLFVCIMVLLGSVQIMAQKTKTTSNKARTTAKRVVKKTPATAQKAKAATSKWAITNPVRPNELRTENVSKTRVISTKKIVGNTYTKIDTVSVDTVFAKSEPMPADTSYTKVDPAANDTTYTNINNGVRTTTTVKTFTINLQMDGKNNEATLKANRPLTKIVLKKASGDVVKELDAQNATECTVPLKGLKKGEYHLVCNAENGQVRTFVVKINK